MRLGVFVVERIGNMVDNLSIGRNGSDAEKRILIIMLPTPNARVLEVIARALGAEFEFVANIGKGWIILKVGHRFTARFGTVQREFETAQGRLTGITLGAGIGTNAGERNRWDGRGAGERDGMCVEGRHDCTIFLYHRQ
jgi:hypothetical protein